MAKEDGGKERARDACILESSLIMPSASRRVGGLTGLSETLTKGFWKRNNKRKEIRKKKKWTQQQFSFTLKLEPIVKQELKKLQFSCCVFCPNYHEILKQEANEWIEFQQIYKYNLFRVLDKYKRPQN